MSTLFLIVGCVALLVHSIVVSLWYRDEKRAHGWKAEALKRVREDLTAVERDRDGYRKLLNEERKLRLADLDRLNGEVIERNRLLTLHVDRWSLIVDGPAWRELCDTTKHPPRGARYELRRVYRLRAGGRPVAPKGTSPALVGKAA